MMKISKTYKCRSCEATFVVDEEGIGSVSVLRIISYDKCPNCCLKSSNGARTVVLADLLKYVVLE